MNPFAIVLLAGAILLAGCAPLAGPSEWQEKDIRVHLDSLGRAVVERDAAAIESLVAIEFTFSQPDTFVSGKRELLAAVTPESDFTFIEHRVTEIQTRFYESTAVSNGRFFVRGTYHGNAVSHGVRFTSVHVRRDGRWQLVALHSTFEPDDK